MKGCASCPLVSPPSESAESLFSNRSGPRSPSPRSGDNDNGRVSGSVIFEELGGWIVFALPLEKGLSFNVSILVKDRVE
jgi:hypothetical protein